MIFRVEVSPREAQRDARGESIRRQAESLGVSGTDHVTVSDLYFLDCDAQTGGVSPTAERVAQTLLCDPVIEEVEVSPLPLANGREARSSCVEVTLRPGVTDSVAETLLSAARTLGAHDLVRVATGQRYTFGVALEPQALRRLAECLLANAVIQTYSLDAPIDPPFVPAREADGAVETISLCSADANTLQAISSERRLALDLAEMSAIQDYFRRAGRDPTDLELEMLAQTWSEHCVHKTFKALIDYTELAADGTPVPGSRREIDSLLNTYIRAATEELARPWVYSAFVDNAGIVAFDESLDLAFKVETHNHPSALEPFGGANTGVGGVVRDVIGVSARPIANTDILCFGPPDMPLADVPVGAQHPRRTAEGVIAGVEDYGNKMGIPTVNGAVLYDPAYTANPLVFCGCVGILPHGAHRNTPAVGDLVVVLGGRTGRDGLRGATFSSMEMTHETATVAGSAVQIGHPIHEKQVLEAVIQARDAGLYSAITDCGAGGLSSAIGEMAQELGAQIHLERVPLKYPGLRPWEIWLSEAQERMVVAVPPPCWPRLARICADLDVEATDLGHFTGDGRLALVYEGQPAGDVAIDFLHHGIPRRRLEATWTLPAPSHEAPPQPASCELRRLLLAILALPDTRSKEDVVRRYDHEVQGATVVKPFVGPAGSGPADAAVLAPFAHASALLSPQGRGAGVGRLPMRGVAIAAGINPHYGMLDPYAMAWSAVDEAVRNCVAVGADPDQVALLDNFCWGNPNLPDRLGSLVRCAQGCHDAALAYRAPFVSGKDSLNNEYTGADGRKHAIPGTLLVSALAIVPDVACSVTSDLKAPGNWLYLAGLTLDELGGSAYARLLGWGLGRAPQPKGDALGMYRAVHEAMRRGWVRACHDLSEGGLAVAAAEMAMGGRIGLDLDLAAVPRADAVRRDDVIAFSESSGRLLLEVAPGDAPLFEALLGNLPLARVGQLRGDGKFVIQGAGGKPVIDISLAGLDRAWRGHIA